MCNGRLVYSQLASAKSHFFTLTSGGVEPLTSFVVENVRKYIQNGFLPPMRNTVHKTRGEKIIVDYH